MAKDSLWKSHAEGWSAQLRRIAAESKGFRITYEHIVATDSAVIALARPSEPVNSIRQMIGERLRLPPETRNEAPEAYTPPSMRTGPRHYGRFSTKTRETSARKIPSGR